MADKTTTAEDAASALDGSELIRIVQGGVNKKATVTQVKTFGSADIQTNINAAQALLASSGSAITAGQGYIIDNGGVLQLPTGISLMRVRGINLPSGVKGFDPNAEAYITALATYVPCTYDVGTNKINVTIETVFRVTQTGGGDPTFEVMRNDLIGVTFTAFYNDVGKYSFSPSIFLSSTFNEIYVHMTGTQVIAEDAANPFGLVSGYYDEANDVMRFGSQVLDLVTGLTPTDGIITALPMYLVCIISN